MTDPLLPPETFADAMDEATRLSPYAVHAPCGDTDSAYPPGTLTIDKDLPPVDAAPKPKGPAWRLQALREWRRGEQ